MPGAKVPEERLTETVTASSGHPTAATEMSYGEDTQPCASKTVTFAVTLAYLCVG